jgi:hypothetical protein
VDWILLSCSCYPGHEDCCHQQAAVCNRCCFGETFVERCKVNNVVGGEAGVEGLTEIVDYWEERQLDEATEICFDIVVGDDVVFVVDAVEGLNGIVAGGDCYEGWQLYAVT